MLYSASGCRLFIGDAPARPPGPFPAFGWVEIGETEGLGLLGVEWDTQSIEAFENGCSRGPMVELTAKYVKRRPEMQIVMGNDPLDPGQAILWAAARSLDSYPFRLVFPDGVTVRQWFALVIRLGEVFDTANEVMRLQADLKPVSDPERSEVV